MDFDADGYYSIATGGTDCDDTLNTAYPGAPEYCDSVDNNCDGTVDEVTGDILSSPDTNNIVYMYPDSDGDGHPENGISYDSNTGAYAASIDDLISWHILCGQSTIYRLYD